jgi:hypothetical protein
MSSSQPAVARNRIMVARNMLSIAQAAPAIEALQAAGIEVIVFKGAALLELGLAAPSRPMADVDLLVRPADHRRAVDILLAHGLFLPPPVAGRAVTGKAHGPSAICTPQGTQLDLHWRLYAHRLWPIDCEAIFGASVTFRFGEIVTRRPSNEDLLLTTALDHAKDGFLSAATGAADLTAMTQTLALDWRLILERARAWQCKAALWVALRQAALVGGAQVPAPVLEALRPGTIRRRYLEAILDIRSAPAYRFRHHSLRMRQLVSGLALVDEPRHYLRAAARFGVLRARDAVYDRTGSGRGGAGA